MADRLHRGAGRGAKWRYTLPETENISTARSSPLVFRSSTPKHDDESNQTSGLEKNNDSQSGEKKRKLSSDSDLIQKKGKEKKKAKWVWSDDKVEEMLKFVREYKSTYDFQRLYIGETGRRLGDRFREHLLDVKNNSQDVSKPVARHFNQPGHSHNNMKIFGLSLHQGNTESRKCTEQRLIFKIGTLSPAGINERFSFS